MDVFQELSSRKKASYSRAVAASGNSATSAQSFSGGGKLEHPTNNHFVTADDRQLLLAVLLHCADIGNSVMPYRIAERYHLSHLSET